MVDKKILLLFIVAVTTLIAGCNGDSKKEQFLEPEQQTPRLVAYPQVFELKIDETQNIDLSDSVIADDITHWSVTDLDDKGLLGRISDQQEQAFTYTAEKSGVGYINYTVSGDGLTSSSQIVVVVNAGDTPGNTNPTAQNVALETNSNTSVSTDLREFISDADGDDLTITNLISGSGRFTLSDDGYHVTFTPNGYVGIDQATYSVDDGKGGYTLAYIIANATNKTPGNTPPQAQDTAVTMDVAQQATQVIDLTALISDPDGDNVTITHLYSTNSRAVLMDGTHVQYTPGNFRGVDQFTYLVSDGRGGYALATVTMTVQDSSVQPAQPTLTAYPQILRTVQGSSEMVDITRSVATEGIDTWSLTSAEDKSGLGVISELASQSFTYLAQASGIATIDYQVSGGGLSSASSIVDVINGPPTPDNTPPEAENITRTTTTEISITVDLNDSISDIDGDPLTVTNLISASGRFTLNNQQVTFTPGGFVGKDQAVYTVEDGRGGYAAAYVVVTSEETNPTTPNSPPKAEDYNYVMDVESQSSWSFDLNDLNLISDADGDILKIEHIYSADTRAVQVGDTEIRYTPGDFRGVDQFTYSVTDNKGGLAVGSINVVVNSSAQPNQIPVAGAITASMSESDTAKTISVLDSVSDADADALEIIKLSGSIGEVSVNPNNPLEVIYEPNGFTGDDRFDYIISDGKGGLAIATITVTVVPVNQAAPVADIVRIETTPDAARTIDLSGYISDADTDISDLTITSIGSPTSPATATLSGTMLTYTPNDYRGIDTFTYTVSDGEFTDVGDIVIVSSPDTDANLVANDISVTTSAGVSIEIDLSSEISTSNPATEPLTIISAPGASLGSVTVNDADKKLIYTPKVGDYGTDTFVYNIKDSLDPAHYAQGVVKVDILPPPLPEITALTISGTPTIGGELTAQVVCATCNSSQYTYDWIINGLTVSTSSTYVYQATNPDLNIRLEVTGVDIYGQKANAYTVYRVSVIEEIAVTDDDTFAGLKNDGSVVTWGSGGTSLDISQIDVSNGVTALSSSRRTFAAEKEDASIVWWDLSNDAPDLNDIHRIVSSDFAFAGITDNGAVVTWGDDYSGGDSSAVTDEIQSGVVDIVSSTRAFAALKDDGSVVTWGASSYGGNSSSVDFSGGVKEIIPSGTGFAAIKKDNSVVYWPSGSLSDISPAPADIADGVLSITSTSARAYAALKDDGSVIVWGSKFYGADTGSVDLSSGSGITRIVGTSGAFAALKSDHSVVIWGDRSRGGVSGTADLSQDIVQVYSNLWAFAAIKQASDSSENTVITWGNSSWGGDSSRVDFSGGVKAIYGSSRMFSAIKNDGTVVAWGKSSNVNNLAQPYIELVTTSVSP